jgi:hypothetical protein
LRNYALNNLAVFADMHFPDITQQLQSKEQLKLEHINYQDLPRQWQGTPNEYWTGSSGYWHLTLAKKLGFWRHSNDRRRGWWKLSTLDNTKDIYYKYTQHEDKRNSDQ